MRERPSGSAECQRGRTGPKAEWQLLPTARSPAQHPPESTSVLLNWVIRALGPLVPPTEGGLWSDQVSWPLWEDVKTPEPGEPGSPLPASPHPPLQPPAFPDPPIRSPDPAVSSAHSFPAPRLAWSCVLHSPLSLPLSKPPPLYLTHSPLRHQSTQAQVPAPHLYSQTWEGDDMKTQTPLSRRSGVCRGADRRLWKLQGLPAGGRM
ncbi:pollen-specific leucine-rich repeat extensin-like protein 3 [Homo sapiens]|uniref:pollen-specific leucine-rich repeat extensin-like protein 3 n=1 Tax=Homo sapiens TaxID=9606 RepID=UPI001FB18FF1|nr:pollen-specific leucine-rich repeat extensin-like protein 3 [Homo sapiens]